LKEFGGIDYAVNNAGIGGPIIPTGEMPFDAWQRCIDVNLNVSQLGKRETHLSNKAQLIHE